MCLLGSPFKSAVLASPDQVKKHGRDCSWRCSHGSQKRVLPPSQHELKFDLHIVSTPLSTVCTTFRWSHIVLSCPKHPAHGEFGTLFLVLYPCDGVSLLGRPARGTVRARIDYWRRARERRLPQPKEIQSVFDKLVAPPKKLLVPACRLSYCAAVALSDGRAQGGTASELQVRSGSDELCAVWQN